MKTIIALTMAAAITVSAADKKMSTASAAVPVADAPKKSIFDGLTLSPVGVYKTEGFASGPSEWGAGVDIGLPIQRSRVFSLHVRAMAFEGPGQKKMYDWESEGFVTTGEKPWGGSAIDELSVYGRGDFFKFAKDKLVLFATSGGGYHWDESQWSLAVGFGAEYRFTENISITAGREVHAYMKGTKDWRSTVSVNWRF